MATLEGKILSVNCGKGSHQQLASQEEANASLAALCRELEPDVILLQEYS